MEKSQDMSARKSLEQMLVEAGVVTAEQIDNARTLQQQNRGKLGKVLVEQGLVTPQDLAMVQSIHLNVPFIDLKRHVVQPRAVRLVPEEIARKFTLIPLDIIADALVVVMAEPEDVMVLEGLRARCKMRVSPALGVPSDIKDAINRNYNSGGEIEKQVNRLAPPPVKREENPVTSDQLAQTPVVQIVDLVVGQGVKDRASDIHIEPQEDRLRVRFRVDGILRDAFSLPLGIHGSLISRIKILAEMNIAEQRRPQDGQFSMKVGDKETDIRVATTDTSHGERVTLRLLDKSLALFTLSELGFLPDVLKKYNEMLNSPFGMILVSGPTGSGKTTTLYASVNQLDRNERNIMTIEDPIEYHFHDITQMQVNPKAGMTFGDGLRTVMRHDPDVILVGEIRDADTARMAVQASLTGHLVLSSIHANDSVGVLFRLMDLGIEAYFLAATLVGVVAQRIIRRICPHCRAMAVPSLEERYAYYEEMTEERGAAFKGSGCEFCGKSGYLGRIGVYECLVMSTEIRKMLLAKASPGDIREAALREGLITMKRDGMMKVKKGITTSYEVMRNVFSVD